jgi:hypothetical protein
LGLCTRARGARKGLVALVFLLAVAPIGAARPQGERSAAEGPAVLAGSAAAGLTPKGWEEVQRSSCGGAYRKPLNLLFLLPGTLFFAFALPGRRRRRLLPFLSLLLLLGLSPEGAEQLVRGGEQAYRQGRFQEAARLYGEASELLPCNPALSYDLAIALHGAGQRGPAIHHLRRSLKGQPADGQVQAALQSLERSYGLLGQLPAPPGVHPDLFFWLSIVLCNLSLVTAAFVVRRRGVQVLIAFVLLVIAMGSSLGLFLGYLGRDSQRGGVVVSEGVGLQRIPEADSGNWLELPAGTSLRVRGETGGYYLVETSSRLQGWVPKDQFLLD